MEENTQNQVEKTDKKNRNLRVLIVAVIILFVGGAFLTYQTFTISSSQTEMKTDIETLKNDQTVISKKQEKMADQIQADSAKLILLESLTRDTLYPSLFNHQEQMKNFVDQSTFNSRLSKQNKKIELLATQNLETKSQVLEINKNVSSALTEVDVLKNEKFQVKDEAVNSGNVLTLTTPTDSTVSDKTLILPDNSGSKDKVLSRKTWWGGSRKLHLKSVKGD
jgi:hypothetical protein